MCIPTQLVSFYFMRRVFLSFYNYKGGGGFNSYFALDLDEIFIFRIEYLYSNINIVKENLIYVEKKNYHLKNKKK